MTLYPVYLDVAIQWDGPAHHTLWLHINREHDGNDTGGSGRRDRCQGNIAWGYGFWGEWHA